MFAMLNEDLAIEVHARGKVVFSCTTWWASSSRLDDTAHYQRPEISSLLSKTSLNVLAPYCLSNLSGVKCSESIHT
jgi:hypothetical protein